MERGPVQVPGTPGFRFQGGVPHLVQEQDIPVPVPCSCDMADVLTFEGVGSGEVSESSLGSADGSSCPRFRKSPFLPPQPFVEGLESKTKSGSTGTSAAIVQEYECEMDLCWPAA